MAYDAYPTVEEITSWYSSNGLSLPTNLQATLAEVITDFEQRTGYVPFLGSTEEADWRFDPPYRVREFVLNLEGGFWEISSIKIDGASVEYTPLPLNAENLGKGWNMVRFLDHPGFKLGSVVVKGKRGYSESLPDDVYAAIFNETIGRCMDASVGSSSVLEERQGGRTVKYGKGAGFADDAFARFESAIYKYVRI